MFDYNVHLSYIISFTVEVSPSTVNEMILFKNPGKYNTVSLHIIILNIIKYFIIFAYLWSQIGKFRWP